MSKVSQYWDGGGGWGETLRHPWIFGTQEQLIFERNNRH